MSEMSAQIFTENETLYPPDYENVLFKHATASDRDPLSFPMDDLQIGPLPRPWRTLQPTTPLEPMFVVCYRF